MRKLFLPGLNANNVYTLTLNSFELELVSLHLPLSHSLRLTATGGVASHTLSGSPGERAGGAHFAVQNVQVSGDWYVFT